MNKKQILVNEIVDLILYKLHSLNEATDDEFKVFNNTLDVKLNKVFSSDEVVINNSQYPISTGLRAQSNTFRMVDGRLSVGIILTRFGSDRRYIESKDFYINPAFFEVTTQTYRSGIEMEKEIINYLQEILPKNSTGTLIQRVPGILKSILDELKEYIGS